MKWSRRKPWWLTEGHPGLSLRPAHPWTPHSLHRQAQTLMCAARLHRTLWVPGSTGRVEGACTVPCCSPAGREVGSKGRALQRGRPQPKEQGKVRCSSTSPKPEPSPLAWLPRLRCICAWEGMRDGVLAPFWCSIFPYVFNCVQGLLFVHAPFQTFTWSQFVCRKPEALQVFLSLLWPFNFMWKFWIANVTLMVWTTIYLSDGLKSCIVGCDGY